MYIGNNMVWRSMFISFLISGALAQNEVTDGMKINLRDIVTRECARNQAVDRVDDVMDSILGFLNCTNGLLNTEAIANEVDEARKHGALDDKLVHKHCVQSPQLKACMKDLVHGISPCIDTSYRAQLLEGKAIFDQMLDFACFMEGKRIKKSE